MRISYIPLILAIGILTGCEDSTPSKTATSPETPKANTTTQQPAPPAPLPSPPAESEKAATPPSAVANTNANTQPSSDLPPDMVEEKAHVGMGDKGRDYGGEGIITTPISTYFKIRERIGIDQITHAMQLFKELEGHYPRTEDEFMKRIIKENGIQLPTLPPGHYFRYDPKSGDLMVVQPKE